MADKVTNYNIPDFGPDDDTEDMTGVSIYDSNTKFVSPIPDLNAIPKLPAEQDIYSQGSNGQKKKEEAVE